MTTVKDSLTAAPFGFDFFQAVRILEWEARLRDRGRGEPPRRIGGDTSPAREPVRFAAAVDLSFPAAAVASLAPVGDTTMAWPGGDPAATRPARHDMVISFFGLTGPSGVLPYHYSDLVLRQTRARNRALQAFFDLFNHRLAALFYRAWARHQLPVAFEQSDPTGCDPLTAMFAAFAGLGTAGTGGRLAVSDLTVFHFAGHYARTAPAAAALEALLADYFGLPARIEPFRARWIRLAVAEQSALPDARRRAGAYASLGRDAVAGEMVYDVASAFRVRLGPMDDRAFESFVPGGRGLKRAADLVRLYAGADLDFDIQCVVQRGSVPPGRLTATTDYAPRLGWNTWLAWADRDVDADDPVFRPEDA